MDGKEGAEDRVCDTAMSESSLATEVRWDDTESSTYKEFGQRYIQVGEMLAE